MTKRRLLRNYQTYGSKPSAGLDSRGQPFWNLTDGTQVSLEADSAGVVTLRTVTNGGTVGTAGSPTYAAGTYTFAGNVTATGDLSGVDVNASGDVTVTGTVTGGTITGTTVTGTTVTAGTLSVTGNATVAGTQTVVGDHIVMGDSLSDTLVVSAVQGEGIKLNKGNPQWSWHDLLGAISIRGVGATDPAYNVYRGGIRQHQFGVNNEVFVEFHLGHDYAMGTDIYLHCHWSHNKTQRTTVASGNVTGGTIVWGYEVSYSKGHNQAAFSSPVTTTTTSPTVASTLYQHYIDEVQLSASSPTASQLDTDDLEVDGVILVRVYLSANNLTVDAGNAPAPFLHYVDIHYQSTGGIGTLNKSPAFNGDDSFSATASIPAGRSSITGAGTQSRKGIAALLAPRASISGTGTKS